jgi:hypothetical protein
MICTRGAQGVHRGCTGGAQGVHRGCTGGAQEALGFRRGRNLRSVQLRERGTGQHSGARQKCASEGGGLDNAVAAGAVCSSHKVLPSFLPPSSPTPERARARPRAYPVHFLDVAQLAPALRLDFVHVHVNAVGQPGHSARHAKNTQKNAARHSILHCRTRKSHFARKKR